MWGTAGVLGAAQIPKPLAMSHHPRLSQEATRGSDLVLQTPRLNEGAGLQTHLSAQKCVSGVSDESADFYFLVGSRWRRTIKLPSVAHNAGGVLLHPASPAPWFRLMHHPSFLPFSELGSPGFLKTYESFSMFSANIFFLFFLFKLGPVDLCWDGMSPSEIQMLKP